MTAIVFIHGLWLHRAVGRTSSATRQGGITTAPEWPRSRAASKSCARARRRRRARHHRDRRSLRHDRARYHEPPIMIGPLVRRADHDDPARPRARRGRGGDRSRAAEGNPQPAPAQLKARRRRPRCIRRSARCRRPHVKQFTYGFVNTFPPDGRGDGISTATRSPTRQAALRGGARQPQPEAANKVGLQRDRAPLLLTAGEEDNTVPASVSRSIYKKSASLRTRTDMLEFPESPHMLIAGEGGSRSRRGVERWHRGSADG